MIMKSRMLRQLRQLPLHAHFHIPSSNGPVLASRDEAGRRRGKQNSAYWGTVGRAQCFRADQQRDLALMRQIMFFL